VLRPGLKPAMLGQRNYGGPINTSCSVCRR